MANQAIPFKILGFILIQAIAEVCFCPSTLAAGYETIYQWAPNSYKDPSISAKSAIPAVAPSEISLSHDRANEIRSLMAGFISSKIAAIQDLEGDNNGMRQLLGHYCTLEEQRDDDKLSTCAKRYIQVQRPILYKLKRGMEESSDAQGQLICTRDISGMCLKSKATTVTDEKAVGFEVRDKNDPTLQTSRAVLPYLPTYEDLQNFARNDTQKKPLTQGEYNAWVTKSFQKSDNSDWYKKNVATEPILEDFLKSKEVFRDDRYPDLGKLTIIEKDKDGKPTFDKVSFDTAHKEWEDNRAEMLGTMKKDVRQNSDWKKTHEAFISNPKPVLGSDLNFDIYAQSRGKLVDEANKMTKAPRTVKQTVKPKASPTPNSLAAKGNTTDTTQKNTVQAQPKEIEKTVPYQGDEKVDTVRFQGGVKENVQNSVSYDSNSFSVEKVLEYKDLDPDSNYKGLDPE